MVSKRTSGAWLLFALGVVGLLLVLLDEVVSSHEKTALVVQALFVAALLHAITGLYSTRDPRSARSSTDD